MRMRSVLEETAMRVFGHIFLFWRAVGRDYEDMKNDPEKQPKSVRLGVGSLIMSIVGAALTLLFVFLALKCLSGSAFKDLTGGEALAAALVLPLFIIIGAILCIAFAAGCYLRLVVGSLLYAVYQRRLNKRAIGTVALVVGILLCIATVAAAIWLILPVIVK